MILFSILRSVLGLLVFVLWTAFMSILFIVGLWIHLPRSFGNKVICLWAEWTLTLFGVELIEEGRENLVKDSCLYLFSHTSFFDVFVMAARLPDMRFGAKVELFRIPIFGSAIRMAGVLPIARDNLKKVIRVYEKATQKAMQGRQYALSPEGTRNTVEDLKPFKSGPFIFAIQSQTPIIPVIIHGAIDVLHPHEFLPNWRKWKSTITVRYLPMIDVHGYSLEQRHDLQKIVFDVMKVHFPRKQT